jgi:hypothetical protein
MEECSVFVSAATVRQLLEVILKEIKYEREGKKESK